MTSERDIRGYNAGAMILHWAIALAILFQLAVGFTMMRTAVLPDGVRFAVFQWHKSVGLLVLTLTIARIAWRVFNPPPAHAPMRPVEAAASTLVHAALYALMLAVPLTGWLAVSVSPTAIPTLLMMSERLPWPNLPVPVAWVGETGEDVASLLHTVLAYGTAALLVLHVAGALKHSIVDRMPSLSRILPIGHLPRQSTALVAIPVAAGLACLFLAGGLALGSRGVAVAEAESSAAVPAAVAAGVSDWAIDPAASTIGYEVAFSGKTIAGTVKRWSASIRFDPGALDTSRAEITLDAASIEVADPFVRSNVSGADGFDVAAHPAVTVRLDRFTRDGDGFRGQGTIVVKDRTAPVDLAFAYAEDAKGAAHVTGSAVLDRLDLGLGAKNDPTGQYLGKEVKVLIDLHAAPAPAAGGS